MYFVIYKWYSEYNQFEGSWDWQVDKFDSLKKAKSMVESLKENSDAKNVTLTKEI